MGGAWPWMAAIPVTRVRARLRPARAWTLPEAPEVTLRGALGRALFEERCVRPDRKCGECPHRDTCLIPTWYDPGLVGSPAARPFVVRAHAEAREVGPERAFGAEWFFFGPVPDPDALQAALVRMARDGLGAERVPHELHVEVEGPAGLDRFVREPLGAPWHLELLTPLQVEKSRARPPVSEVLRSAMLRVRSVARAVGATVERRWDLERVRGVWVESERVEGSRYSARQGETVDLSGWVGRIALTEGAEEVEDLLAAAEVLHVGRATSAGLGWVERQVERAEGPRLVAPVGAHPEVVADVVRSLGGVSGVMLVGFAEAVRAAEEALATVFDGAVARFVLTPPVLGHPQLRRRIDAGEGDGFLGADVLLLAGEGLAGLAAWALAARSGGRVRRIAWEGGEVHWWD